MRRIVIIVLILMNLILGGFLLRILIKDRTPIFHPFDVNFNISEKNLIDNGYFSIPEDVSLLGKRIGDTLIYYQLHAEYMYQSNEVYWRNCEIRIAKADSLRVVEFIEKHDCYIISKWNMENPRFFVRNGKNNMIYDCSIYKDTEFKDVLSISLFFPKDD